MADDLGVGDLSCYGQKKFSTPNIDSIAADGMKFNAAYAGCTVCAPSRSVLMTGKHMGHTSVIAERALSFIERNHRQPFFCYVPFTVPHWELLVPENSLKKYRGKFEERGMIETLETGSVVLKQRLGGD